MQVVLNTFEAQPLSEEEGADNNLEEEGTAFNIKYLTSSKLMGLEVSDTEKIREFIYEHISLIFFSF